MSKEVMDNWDVVFQRKDESGKIQCPLYKEGKCSDKVNKSGICSFKKCLQNPQDYDYDYCPDCTERRDE